MRRMFSLLAVAGLVAAAMLAPPVSAKVKPDISIWEAYASGGTAEPAAFAAVLARVQAHNPKVTISAEDHSFGSLFSDFFGSAASGAPDLMVAPNDVLYGEWQSGLISDVGSVLHSRLRTLRPAAIAGSTVDGHLVQVPESLKAIALYYDKDQLRKPPTTTGKFLDALKAGTKLGIIGNGGELLYAYGFYGAFGGRILNDQGRCVADRTPGVANALAWLHKATDAGLVIFGSAQEAAAALVSGDVAGYLEGNWVFGDLAAAMGSRLGVVTGPSGPGGPFRSLVGVDGYVVNAASPDLAAATNVALDMTDRSAQVTFMGTAGHIPADRTIGVTDSRLRAFEQATEDGVVRPMMAEFDAYWGFFGDAYGRVVYGGENASAVVHEDCAAMNASNGF